MPSIQRVRRLKVRLRSGEQVVIPAWVLDSGKPGPALLVTAAQHGNEVQGAEVIRRFVELATKRMRCGKVFAVPMVNLPAIRDRRPHTRMKPEQAYGDDRGHNMNRWWPGKRGGNDTARIPACLYEAFGDEATHALDLHCWNKRAAPAVLIRDMPEIRELARKLGDRFVQVCPPGDRTLGGYFAATGRVGLTYEFSGQYTIEERQVERGVRLVTNLAKAIGLIPGRLARGDVPVLFSDACGSVDIAAPCSGLFVLGPQNLGDAVKKGERLGHVISDVDLASHEIRSPQAGYLRVFGAARDKCDVAMPGHHPYVTKGERLATIVVAPAASQPKDTR